MKSFESSCGSSLILCLRNDILEMEDAAKRFEQEVKIMQSIHGEISDDDELYPICERPKGADKDEYFPYCDINFNSKSKKPASMISQSRGPEPEIGWTHRPEAQENSRACFVPKPEPVESVSILGNVR